MTISCLLVVSGNDTFVSLPKDTKVSLPDTTATIASSCLGFSFVNSISLTISLRACCITGSGEAEVSGVDTGYGKSVVISLLAHTYVQWKTMAVRRCCWSFIAIIAS